MDFEEIAWLRSSSPAWRLLRADNAPLVLSFLHRVFVEYWGDIDTHGFAILNRLRHRFSRARSILMDRGTLLAHQSQWVTEATPTRAALGLLTPAERELYADLVDGTFGPAIRLERERISFADLERAVDQR